MQATATATLSAQTGKVMPHSKGGAPTRAREARQASPSIRQYGSCIKGFMAGLCMEGALALGLYAMYHLGHMLR